MLTTRRSHALKFIFKDSRAENSPVVTRFGCDLERLANHQGRSKQDFSHSRHA